ncbi:MAG: DUF7507 domain-containing protein [Actinomycetota bacterium]
MVVLAVLTALMPALLSPASATHVVPEFRDGNPTCAQLVGSEEELRINDVADGTFDDGVLFVTIDVRDTADGPVFDFEANIPVEAVFVKGGSNGNLYVYDPPEDEDTGLHAPVNPANDKYYGLSHISFCYTPVPSTLLQVAAGADVIHSGDEVTFTITEENDGSVPLTGAHVTTDPEACGAVLTGPTGDTANPGVLDPGETWTWTCTFEVTGDPDLDFTLTVIGHGTTPAGDDVTFCEAGQPTTGKFCDEQEKDDVTVDIINPSTDVGVTADPDVIKAGESVEFTFTEENDGDADLTSPYIVTDSDACNDDLQPPTGDADTDGVLDQGETWSWTCTIPVSGDPDLDFSLIVLGHGTDPTGDDVTWCADVTDPGPNVFCDQDERATVTVDIINPSTDVDVTAPGTTFEPATPVEFTITETNDGDADLTSPSVVTDSTECNTTLLYGSGDADTDGVLDQGEIWSWTCTVTLPDAPGTDFTLTATGHGFDPTGDDVTWCADVTDPGPNVFCDQDERDSVTVGIREVFEGLTPGYWKNHLDSWDDTPYVPTDTTLEDVFDVPDALGLDDVTLLEALSLKGGSGTKGAAQTLLRAAVAALLNAAHPNIDYPRTTGEVIADVNEALTGDRAAMLALASELDADNNLGGDIDT